MLEVQVSYLHLVNQARAHPESLRVNFYWFCCCVYLFFFVYLPWNKSSEQQTIPTAEEAECFGSIAAIYAVGEGGVYANHACGSGWWESISWLCCPWEGVDAWDTHENGFSAEFPEHSPGTSLCPWVFCPYVRTAWGISWGKGWGLGGFSSFFIALSICNTILGLLDNSFANSCQSHLI